MGDKRKTRSGETPEDDKLVDFPDLDQFSTQTICLENLLIQDLSSSGSFDIRGDIWKTTFGKLLQALPIPALLIDNSYRIVTANTATEKIPRRQPEDREFLLVDLFPDLSVAEHVLSLVKEVFSDRKPRVTETILGCARHRIWSRMTFRSIRIREERFLLAVFEDLTAERKMLLLKEKEDQIIRRVNTELEKRVQDRTDELTKTNEALGILINSIQKLREEERRTAARNLLILVEPLLNKLKSEPAPPDHVRSITKALEMSLREVFGGYRPSVAKTFPTLTPKELEVAELLVSGLSSKQIASIMGVEDTSVQTHRYSIRKKLGISNTSERLANWLRKKLRYPTSADPD